MKVLRCSVLLILWACCGAQEPCTASPEEMAKNNIILRWTADKKLYMEHDQYIDFVCLSRDYIQDKESPPFRIKCNRGILLYPKCIKQEKGSKCGPLPLLQNGDIVGIPQPSYPSGTTVEYKCQSYHKMLGNHKVTCMNGAWSVLPECLEPCTARPEEMTENNLRFRWTENEKVYTEHDQSIEFVCLSRDYIQHPESPPFRTKCNRGKLLYPKCIKQGSCTPSSKEMDPKNIILMNENTEIKDGNMAEFACKPGFSKKPNQIMTVKCTRGNLEYPECDNSLCQVTKDKLEDHFVELSSMQRDKTAFKEGDTIIFRCKPGFRVLTPPGILVANCTKDGFTYPTCINPDPCRVSQEGIDLHNLELVGDKILFHQEDTIQFTCKPGYFAPLAGTCKNSNIIYPTCLPKGSCLLKLEEIEQNNIKLLPAFTHLLYATDDQTIEFTCKEGYIKHTSSSDMSQVCEGGIIAYPTCIKKRT
ncbi:complement factor H-related protein 4-like isoform X2 [Lissotriton helveticus]